MHFDNNNVFFCGFKYLFLIYCHDTHFLFATYKRLLFKGFYHQAEA